MENGELSQKKIAQDLETGLIGREIYYYDSLNSTMETAALMAKKGAVEGTVIITGEQRAGRGRMKRQWLSPKGNVALSLILKPQMEKLPYMIMIASMAVCKSIEQSTGLQTDIKWPNDILVKERKVSGILIQSNLKGMESVYTIIGIGINVCLNPSEHKEISATATSLKYELGREVSRLKLLRQLMVDLEHYYLEEKTRTVYEEWRAKLATLGRNVEISIDGRVHRGTAESVDEDGSLLLRYDDMHSIKVLAGDVHLQDIGGVQSM
jgi:BirA family biotin operon repressor/biotin-[acetyl-CoA-carboxylase] ligase